MPNYKIGIELDAEGNAAGKLKETSGAADALGKALPGVLGFTTAVGAGLVAVGVAAFNTASEVNSATNQIGASLGLSADKAKAYGAAVKAVYANNFGASIADVGTAVEQVAKQLKLAANDPALKTMTENAFRLRDVFEVDVNDSVSAARTLMDNFGIDGQHAFDIIALGYQRGLDRSGDFLDTIGEYSTQFANGGASVSDFFGIMESGLQGGMLGTDKAADAFKEFRIRIQDGSVLTAQSLDSIGLSSADMTAQMSAGTLSARDAFNQVQEALRNTEDPLLRMQAGVGLIGTQFEDMGDKQALAMTMTGDWEEATVGAIDTLNTKYADLGTVAEGMWRKFQVGIAPAGEAVLAVVNENLPLIEQLVGTASMKVVEFVNLIPPAIAEMKKKWDEDFAGMQTTWTEFQATSTQQHGVFMLEWNRTFSEGEGEIKIAWEDLFKFLLQHETDSLTQAQADWTEALKFIRAEYDIWSSLFEGDWQGTWDAIVNTGNLAMDSILDEIQSVFGPGLRDGIASALIIMWDTMKDIWESIDLWWSEKLGALLDGIGLLPDGSPFGLGSSVPAGAGAGASIAATGAGYGSETYVNVYVERGDADVVRDAAEIGVRRAQRSRGE